MPTRQFRENAEQVEAQRASLRSNLHTLMEQFHIINSIMNQVPHSRERATRALVPGKPSYVEQTQHGITIHYEDEKGKYEIILKKL